MSKIKELADKNKNDAALQFVKERFSASEQYTQGYFSRFQRYYELYRSYLQKGKLPWRTNLFIPKTFEIIETIAPRIAQAQRTFKTLPVEGGDVDNAEAYTDLLKFQFYKTDMEDVIEEMTKEALIYGTAVVKVSWGRNGMPLPEVIDIFDFFPDPKARNDKEMKFGIHRVNRDIEDLENNVNYNQDVVKRLKNKKESTSDSQQRTQRLGVIGVTAEDKGRTRFEVLEFHGIFQGKPHIIAIADNELLRNDVSTYGDEWNPFVIIRDQIVPHELYGIGEIEPIESLQNELNDTRNQRMDNVKLVLNRMWRVVSGGVQFEDEIVSRPGGIIHVNRPDGLEPLETADVTQSSFTEEPIIKSDMERTTGANSPLSGALVSPMGGTQGGVMNRTATAYQGAINQADKRFTSKINQIKRGIIKIGRRFLILDQTFMTKPQMVRIVGDEIGAAIVPVYPEDIKNDFDLEVEIEYLDEFQQMQQNLTILQSAREIPGFDVAKFLVDTLERSGKKDVRRYLLQPQPPPPEEPKVNIQLKGDISPDAAAQILDRREGIKSNPDVVAAQMRALQAKEQEQKVGMVTDALKAMPEDKQSEPQGRKQ